MKDKGVINEYTNGEMPKKIEKVAKHHRRSIRLLERNYAGAAMYYITVCVYNRQCLFGDVGGGQMIVNEYG